MRRIVIALFGDADLGKQRFGLCDALGARALLHMDRRFDDVFEHGHVGPEIEALEHHAELRADAVDLAPVGRAACRSRVAPCGSSRRRP